MQENKIICGDWIEVAETLPSGIAHLIITSPPFWGQRLYSWGGRGSCEAKKKPHIWLIDEPIQICQNCGKRAPTLGLEKTPEEHIEKLVMGFRELRRVLRDDGVVFLNYGDKYASKPCGNTIWGNGVGSNKYYESGAIGLANKEIPIGFKQGDLIGLAWRLALALQADGWYLRSDIIWAKALSFGAQECPHCKKDLYYQLPDETDLFGDEIKGETINKKYSGSTMPESVKGWRWERHKIKVKSGGRSKSTGQSKGLVPEDGMTGRNPDSCRNPELQAQWQDCPGCPKCEPNDGLVLRKGSGRPTRAHEYLFLLAKTSNYFYDTEAVREEVSSNSHEKGSKLAPPIDSAGIGHKDWHKYTPDLPSGRNLRDVWCINPQAYPGAHYATFPERLVEPCIKVGTSEKGCCPKCGAPWARIVEKPKVGTWHDHSENLTSGSRQSTGGPKNNYEIANTLGWRPTCQCGIKETTPAIVYEPFMGSGTVPAVAARLGRNYICSELNEDYVKNQAEYRVAEAETGISKEWQKDGQMALWSK